MQIIFVPKLNVTLNSICLKQADNSFYTIISLTGPKQNKDFISQKLQILFCKFLMKQIVTCQTCSHHRISYTSLIFITRFQNWFLQQKTSLPLWKTNSPILMNMHLLYYREENFFFHVKPITILLIEVLIPLNFLPDWAVKLRWGLDVHHAQL